MCDTTGAFNSKGDTYTLSNPISRADYRNVLLNNRGYLFEVNQFGMGKTICKFQLDEINTITENGERTIYFRDDDTNDVWCVAGFPYVSKVENYACTHKPSCTIISSVHNGIKVSIRYFVPIDKQCEIQSVTIENLTNKTKNISAFPAIHLYLQGYKAPTFCNSVHQSYRTDFENSINGLYINGRSAHIQGKPYNAYLTSTTPVQSFSADNRHVFGSAFSFSYPYAILQGGDLDSKAAVAKMLLFVLHTKTVLQPGKVFQTDYILGVTKTLKDAETELQDLKTREDVEIIYQKTKAADLERRSKVMVKTPDDEINRFANYWLKMGIERNILSRTAPRDNLQFANAGVMFLPEAAKITCKLVMRFQYKDGHMVRRWTALDTTYYADGPAWLVSTICTYLKYTDDMDFLNEEVCYFDQGTGTVWEHLMAAISRLDTDRGPHNIQLSRYADWNDALNTGVTDENAESVFVAMQFADNLRDIAELCKYLNKNELYKRFSEKYERQKKIINENCWDREGYYVRSFVNGRTIGSSSCSKGSKIFVNPQSWSIISGVCPPERIESIQNAVDKYIETPYGCRVNYPAYDEIDPDLGRISFQYPGTYENGAVYAHATGFKIYSDCMLSMGDRALSSLKKILPSNPNTTDTIPYTLSNAIELAPESLGSCSISPWGTGTIGWVYRTIVEGLLGIHLTYGGFKAEPAFPSEWDNASISIQRKNTVYCFNINNKHTGKQTTIVNGQVVENNFVAFSNETNVNIDICL